MDLKAKEQTRAAWRELGFFYDRDDEMKQWTIMGSRTGLLKFAQLLEDYAANRANDVPSEHEHYGPYMYLEVMTWPNPGMDDHAIFGPLHALKHLAQLVRDRVARLQPGDHATIKTEFATDAAYTLVLELRGDDFDPVSADASVRD